MRSIGREACPTEIEHRGQAQERMECVWTGEGPSHPAKCQQVANHNHGKRRTRLQAADLRHPTLVLEHQGLEHQKRSQGDQGHRCTPTCLAGFGVAGIRLVDKGPDYDRHQGQYHQQGHNPGDPTQVKRGRRAVNSGIKREAQKQAKT